MKDKEQNATASEWEEMAEGESRITLRSALTAIFWGENSLGDCVVFGFAPPNNLDKEKLFAISLIDAAFLSAQLQKILQAANEQMAKTEKPQS